MKTTNIIGLVVISCIAFGCAYINEESNEALELVTPLRKYGFENLQLYPVIANETFLDHRKNTGPYLSLSEAVKQKKVVVSEHYAGSGDPPHSVAAEVSRLFIENVSSDTVFILNGEIVNGGNQDRMIAQDVLLQPHSGKLDLSVFCVERDRWSGDSEIFSIAIESLPPGEIRKAASMTSDQKVVWENISMKMEVMDVESPTDAIADLKNDADYKADLDRYADQLKDIFNDQKNIVGVIAVVGDRIVGCDLFATNELFATYYPNLLQSYVSEALSYHGKTDAAPALLNDYMRTITEKAGSEGFILTGKQTRNEKFKAHFSMF
jgi:hypothetical protein